MTEKNETTIMTADKICGYTVGLIRVRGGYRPLRVVLYPKGLLILEAQLKLVREKKS